MENPIFPLQKIASDLFFKHTSIHIAKYSFKTCVFNIKNKTTTLVDILL